MNVYAFIIPTVLTLLILEILVDFFGKKGVYNFQDTIANLGTGIGNQCINLAVAFFVFNVYGYLYQFIPWKIGSVWYTWVILLIIQDFVFYWFHRTGHVVKVFWAAHMPHHSSEELNLSVGLRASFTQRIFQFLFFDWILVLMGFSPEMVYATAAIHLLFGFWHHTRLIKNMGWFEEVFVAPSHHRVHHGVNPQYIDKNFSELLIIWDKMFGTYAKEEEEVCYGVTHPPRTWDPIAINFQYWKEIWDDMIAAPYFIDKIKIWFMPLKWRPRGLEQLDPNAIIGYSLKDQTKYYSTQFKNAKPYLLVQLIVSLVYMYITVDKSFAISGFDRIILSSGIFLMIMSWGGILQAKRWSIPLEYFRLLYMGTALIWILDYRNIMPFTGWTSVVISLFAGVSILFVSVQFLKGEVEEPVLVTNWVSK